MWRTLLYLWQFSTTISWSMSISCNTPREKGEGRSPVKRLRRKRRGTGARGRGLGGAYEVLEVDIDLPAQLVLHVPEAHRLGHQSERP